MKNIRMVPGRIIDRRWTGAWIEDIGEPPASRQSIHERPAIIATIIMTTIMTTIRAAIKEN